MMTPALKAMVEAMAAERDRQIVDADVEWAAELDLEKVARAGLESGVLEAAFREGFSDGHLKAGEDRGRYDAPDEDAAWGAYRASVTPASD